MYLLFLTIHLNLRFLTIRKTQKYLMNLTYLMNQKNQMFR
jgi:hypothetical protein